MRHALAIAAVTFAAAALTGTMPRPALAAGTTASAVKPLMIADNTGSGSSLFSLFQQIQQLQQQVRNLQGEVDTLKYRLKQNRQGQQDLYQNLNKRLSALEKGTGGNGATTDQLQGTENPAGSGISTNNNAGTARNTGNAAHNDKGAGDYGSGTGGDYGSGAGGNYAASAPDTDNGADSVDSAAQAAYMDGFNKLKNEKYDAAISAFKGFVSEYPDTSLTDNAWYWLGEAYYIKQHYSAANHAFETLVNRFGNSPKVPGALYKIALIQAHRGQTDNAKGTLHRITQQYPHSNAAKLAQKKLQSMGS